MNDHTKKHTSNSYPNMMFKTNNTNLSLPDLATNLKDLLGLNGNGEYTVTKSGTPLFSFMLFKTAVTVLSEEDHIGKTLKIDIQNKVYSIQ